MARIDKRKSRLTFTTCDVVRERGRLREIVIEAHTHTATVRLLGMRRSFEISYASIYNLAVAKHVEQQRAAKRAAQKGKRK